MNGGLEGKTGMQLRNIIKKERKAANAAKTPEEKEAALQRMHEAIDMLHKQNLAPVRPHKWM